MSAPLGRDPVSWSSWGIFVHSLMVLIFAVTPGVNFSCHSDGVDFDSQSDGVDS